MVVTNFRYTNEFGNTITGPVATGSIVRPTVDIENTSGSELSFAFLVQTQDSNGVTVALTALEDTLQPSESKTYSMGWMPGNSRTFTSTSFFWKSIDDPQAIAASKVISITVEGARVPTIPLEPLVPHAVATSPFKVQITFRDNGDNRFYRIERDSGYGFRYVGSRTDSFSPGDTITFTDGHQFSGPVPDTTHVYRVYGVNSVGKEGFKSFAVSAKTPPFSFLVYTNEIQITDNMFNYYYLPTLGKDAIGRYIVYDSRPRDGFNSIFFQRLDANGYPFESPKNITAIYSDAYAQDAYGDFICYIGNNPYIGEHAFLLYQISNGETFNLSESFGFDTTSFPCKINKNFLLLRQGWGQNGYLIFFDLSNVANMQPVTILPDSEKYLSVRYDVSDRYVVYEELDPNSNIPCVRCHSPKPSSSIIILDHTSNQIVDVISTGNTELMHPAIFDTWVVYASRDWSQEPISTSLFAKNIETGETIQISTNSYQYSSIYGKNIAFMETLSDGYTGVFNYNLEFRQTKQITLDDEYAEIFPNVFEGFMSYQKVLFEGIYPRNIFLRPLPDEVSDLSLTKTVDNPNPIAGDAITYTITLTNDGPTPATDIVVQEQIPTSLVGVQFQLSVGMVDTTTNEWSIPSLDVGQSATLQVTGNIRWIGTLTNIAEVKSVDQFDPDSTPDNNDPVEDDQDVVQLEATLLDVNADLSLTKTVDNPNPVVGDTITFTVVLTNNGPDDVVEEIDVVDHHILIEGFTFVPADADPGTEWNNSDMFWFVDGLPAGESRTLEITGIVNNEGILTNTAEIGGTSDNVIDPDSSPGNRVPTEDDQASVTINVTLDTDNDDIYDTVDSSPNDPTINTFDYGTTSGSIIRGDQILTISDAPNPDGVKVIADLAGGPNPATITDCLGTSYTITPGDDIVITCGSSIVKVIQGPVEVEYVVDGKPVATVILDTGARVAFEQDDLSFTNDGIIAVVLTVNGNELKVSPSQTNQISKLQEGGGCLIATATFGSELAPQVQFLREIRDNTILSTASGTSFMTAFNSFYYLFSPTVADLERQNPVFKEMVKVAITPLLSSLSLLQYIDIDSESEMLGHGIGIIILNVGMYFVVPALVFMKIKYHFIRKKMK